MSGEASKDDGISLEIDGRALQASPGQMIIHAADAAGITIPRFCYHHKLSIAANCRMCLIEVEGMPKPMPACATPIANGMKVHTRSRLARSAQKGVMEFLLINHPLDCPICDQGGECELQDLALGYGRDISRYAEGKRVVRDKDIGPLISTDMTRCIHCTRCVRFGSEVAGIRELGATGRGERTEIGTYIQRSVNSELSGNVIDLCPVGALTSKPFRFRARAWELIQRESIAAHDAMGSNLYVHVRGNEVMRVVPRECEQINETWISDRDRFSYEGLASKDRLQAPIVKDDGRWREVDWEEALARVADGLSGVREQHGAEWLGALVSPSSTLEELYLLGRFMRGLGSSNVDHRLREQDFQDQVQAPVYPSLGMNIAELDRQEAVLLIGCNIRAELPLAAQRLRKAVHKGGTVSVLNPIDYEFHFPVASRLIEPPSAMLGALAAVLKAAQKRGKGVPKALRAVLRNAKAGDVHTGIVSRLATVDRSAVLLGGLVATHPAAATLRALAATIAQLTGSRFGVIPDAANSVGAWLAGAVPHRRAGGAVDVAAGLDAQSMLREARKAYLLLGVEPDLDTADSTSTLAALHEAELVVALSAYASDSLRECADVLLPVCPFSETSGTYVNLQGTWQSFEAVVGPRGTARPAWKVLRVLGNLLGMDGFGYNDSTQVRDELQGLIDSATIQAADAALNELAVPALNERGQIERIGEVPMYASDAVVRRASSLQRTSDGEKGSVRICRALAVDIGLGDGAEVAVTQNGARVILPLVVDERVAPGCARIPAGLPATRELGPAFGTVHLERP